MKKPFIYNRLFTYFQEAVIALGVGSPEEFFCWSVLVDYGIDSCNDERSILAWLTSKETPVRTCFDYLANSATRADSAKVPNMERFNGILNRFIEYIHHLLVRYKEYKSNQASIEKESDNSITYRMNQDQLIQCLDDYIAHLYYKDLINSIQNEPGVQLWENGPRRSRGQRRRRSSSSDDNQNEEPSSNRQRRLE